MQKAKQAVSDILSKDGHHKTTVNEDVNSAVTEERVNPHRHEEVQRAVDRETHQHHHMTTVQPIAAKETLPEQHTHNMAPVQEKRIQHENPNEIQSKLQQEAGKFKNTTVTRDTSHSTSTTADAVGERVHHHVHEHIQPVIQKEVHAPQVVHTTVPVHEVHEAASKHHGTKVLPTKTLEEFKSSGGTLGSKGEHLVGEHDGCPESSTGFKDVHRQGTTQGMTGHTRTGATNAGPHNSNMANKVDPRVDSDRDGRSGLGSMRDDDLHRRNEGSGYTLAGKDTSSPTTGQSGIPRGAGVQGVQTSRVGSNTVHSNVGTTTEERKPSLLDKVNPFSGSH